MAKKTGVSEHKKVIKRTRQGGLQPKMAGMTKCQKRNFKAYRGQGR